VMISNANYANRRMQRIFKSNSQNSFIRGICVEKGFVGLKSRLSSWKSVKTDLLYQFEGLSWTEQVASAPRTSRPVDHRL
jgi:hypothetical protein